MKRQPTYQESADYLHKLMREKLDADMYKAFAIPPTMIGVDYTKGLAGNAPNRIIFDDPVGPAGCRHQWVPYVGFTEAYNFCKHCDKKDWTK